MLRIEPTVITKLLLFTNLSQIRKFNCFFVRYVEKYMPLSHGFVFNSLEFLRIWKCVSVLESTNLKLLLASSGEIAPNIP